MLCATESVNTSFVFSLETQNTVEGKEVSVPTKRKYLDCVPAKQLQYILLAWKCLTRWIWLLVIKKF